MHAMPPSAVMQSTLDNDRDDGEVAMSGNQIQQHGLVGALNRDVAAAKREQAVRRRVSRACDQCNQLRTKCDAGNPCTHCAESGLQCEYARERKKRGKASKKDIAAQEATAATGEDNIGSWNANIEHATSYDDAHAQLASPQSPRGTKRKRSRGDFRQPALPTPPSGQTMSHHLAALDTGAGIDVLHPVPDGNPLPNDLPMPRAAMGGPAERTVSAAMSDYGSIDDYHRSMLHPAASVAGLNFLHSGTASTAGSMVPGIPINNYAAAQVPAASPRSQQGFAEPPYRAAESPMSFGFLGQSPVAGSPAWLPLPSPSPALYPTQQLHDVPLQTLRYPVLRPLVPHIASIVPTALACDLLEVYFTSTSSVFMQPQSPYILGYIFRKRSFLRHTNPRVCSPALLASMLWVAAQTSDAAFLTSPPTARGRVCQKLLELTVRLLRPLIHTPANQLSGYDSSPGVNGVSLGGLGVPLPGRAYDFDSGSPGASGALDDVATYLHLATVVSASEYKAASLRWWNAAWSLARELKLGRELPPNPEGTTASEMGNVQAKGPPHVNDTPHRIVHEEEREERRRIWWLLFCMDRHLGLAYNKPLSLLDVECAELLQPQNELVWQADEFYTDEHGASSGFRRRGPPFECSGHSIFGYFLPLMSILGEIVELHQAQNHPRFGLHSQDGIVWAGQINEIARHLDAYDRSLKVFENSQHVDAMSSAAAGDAAHQRRLQESKHQTKMVVAYGTHLMHTLHILLNGRWDPISLLDDNDLWISSQSFVAATGHAVSASEALNDILDYDPDLSFMPFFFGIYLLQSSFLLLLIADKLQGEAGASVVKACETIVRAHEACVVTLNTEYQRTFRNVMLSALAQVRGRAIEDLGEQQNRRREVLALYRWTGDGTGLAL